MKQVPVYAFKGPSPPSLAPAAQQPALSSTSRAEIRRSPALGASPRQLLVEDAISVRREGEHEAATEIRKLSKSSQSRAAEEGENDDDAISQRSWSSYVVEGTHVQKAKHSCQGAASPGADAPRGSKMNRLKQEDAKPYKAWVKADSKLTFMEALSSDDEEQEKQQGKSQVDVSDVPAYLKLESLRLELFEEKRRSKQMCLEFERTIAEERDTHRQEVASMQDTIRILLKENRQLKRMQDHVDALSDGSGSTVAGNSLHRLTSACDTSQESF